MINNDLLKDGDELMFRRLSLGLSLFALVLSGCVISPRRDGTTSGGGGGGGGGTTATGKLYVTNQAQNAILRFDNASTGQTSCILGTRLD